MFFFLVWISLFLFLLSKPDNIIWAVFSQSAQLIEQLTKEEKEVRNSYKENKKKTFIGSEIEEKNYNAIA